MSLLGFPSIVTCHWHIIRVSALLFLFALLWFSFLALLLWLESQRLKRSGDNGHPCLVSVFRGNSCSFPPFRMMLAVGRLYIAFMMLRNVPSIPSLYSTFSINGCWILSNAFSTSIEMIMWFFSFASVYMVNYMDWFSHVEPALHPGDEPNLIMVYNFLDVVWMRIANILLSSFASKFISNIGL